MVEGKFKGDSETLAIDKFNLDEECIRQPQLFLDAAELAVYLAEERDIAKLDMDKTEAKVEEAIRKRIAMTNEKRTEGAIATEVELDPKYIAAQEYYIRKKSEAALADATRQAFEQRKTMLELVCRLYLSEYFSDVSVKAGSKVSEGIALDTIKKEVSKGMLKKTVKGGEDEY